MTGGNSFTVQQDLYALKKKKVSTVSAKGDARPGWKKKRVETKYQTNSQAMRDHVTYTYRQYICSMHTGKQLLNLFNANPSELSNQKCSQVAKPSEWRLTEAGCPLCKDSLLDLLDLAWVCTKNRSGGYPTNRIELNWLEKRRWSVTASLRKRERAHPVID